MPIPPGIFIGRALRSLPSTVAVPVSPNVRPVSVHWLVPAGRTIIRMVLFPAVSVDAKATQTLPAESRPRHGLTAVCALDAKTVCTLFADQVPEPGSQRKDANLMLLAVVT